MPTISESLDAADPGDALNVQDLRREVALACRVLAHRGLVEDVLGHVSWRTGPDELLLRCRGPEERGLRFTESDDVCRVDLAGRLVDESDRANWYTAPNEFPIHTEIMRRRADVFAVVHAHPPAIIVAANAGIELVPMFGSYDIPAARLARSGIPTYGRSVLIRTAALGSDVAATLADGSACILQGHGIVTTGATIREAVLTALAVDRLARIALRIAAVGATPAAMSDADLDELPDLGSGLNYDTLWRHHLACLEADGWLPPRDRNANETDRT